MCGIAGIVHWGRLPDARERVQLMTRAQRHRGPDDERYLVREDLAFGFARLAIVDIAGGMQPMSNEDQSVWTVFNGEIANHRALRRELEAAGHVFATDHSDTEVLVHGYKQWGDGLPARLNGMFAFAIWDHAQRRLLMARDRYGIKPLYLASTADGTLLFASEVKALLASGLVPARGSAPALLEYLCFQNFWHGRTPFEGVTLMPSGHQEIVSRESRRRRQFWDYAFTRRSRLQLREAAERHRETLLRVMERQVDSDVPVTAYLSGGVDSTAVTATAHRLGRVVDAYSCIFDLTGVGEDRVADEREFARAAARALGVRHTELELAPEAITAALDETVRALEYPRMGVSYENFLIADRVADDAKVVLSGMGGDELHGGYVGRYAALGPREPAAAHGGRLGRLLGRWRKRAPDCAPPSWSGLPRMRAMLNVPVAFARLPEALTPAFRRAAADYDPVEALEAEIRNAPGASLWDQLMYLDAKHYLHGLLVLEDKLSMAHSLETRVPLLDNELVDFVLDLPWPLLCDGGTGKIVFRESVRPWVPAEIYSKPKMGFGPPEASWYRGPLRDWLRARLAAPIIAARGIFEPAFVGRILDEHLAGTANHVSLIWSFLCVESWCRQYGVFGGAGPRE